MDLMLADTNKKPDSALPTVKINNVFNCKNNGCTGFRINALMYGGARRNKESIITTKTVRS
jgi:hypothetical protein